MTLTTNDGTRADVSARVPDRHATGSPGASESNDTRSPVLGITFRRTGRDGRTPVDLWDDRIGYVHKRTGYVSGWVAHDLAGRMVLDGTDRNGLHATRRAAADRLALAFYAAGGAR